VQVVVIAYNGSGDIIGGGTGYVDFINAGKTSAVEAYIYVPEVPDHVEMYAVMNQLSDVAP
jgi:hypothetical protein